MPRTSRILMSEAEFTALSARLTAQNAPPPAPDVLGALRRSHAGIRELIAAQKGLLAKVQQPKMAWTKAETPEGVATVWSARLEVGVGAPSSVTTNASAMRVNVLASG